MAGKRRIGPPKKYGNLLGSLDDQTLYSCAMIAKKHADPQVDRGLYRRVLAALHAHRRRNFFPPQGDGALKDPGRPKSSTPAWFGHRWKENLEEKDRGIQPRLRLNSRDQGDSISGKRMKYGTLLAELDPFALYCPETIVDEGLAKGLIEPIKSKGSSQPKDRARIQNGLAKYRESKLPFREDGFVITAKLRPLKAWFGWRWLLALPDYALPEPEKASIKDALPDHWTQPDAAERVNLQLNREGERLLFSLDPFGDFQMGECSGTNPVCISCNGIPHPQFILPKYDDEILLKYQVVLSRGEGEFAVAEPCEPVNLNELSTKQEKVGLILAIAEGLDRLHKKGMVYGWLQPSALVKANGAYKLSRLMTTSDLDFQAPEIGKKALPVPPAADVFSLGRLIQMLCPNLPIWRRCLALDPERRPSMHQVIESISENRRPDHPQRRFGRFSVKRWALVAVISILVIGGAISTQWTPAQNGYWILNHEGPEAAFRFFGDYLASKKSDDDLIYSYAWAAYRGKHYERAQAVSMHLLKTSRNPYLKGHVYFLLGYLFLETEKLEDADGAFKKSLAIYQEREDEKNTHRSLLGLARVALLRDDLSRAEEYLIQADWHSQGGFSLALFYQMKSWLAFKLGDYPAALEFGEKRLEATDEDPSGQGQALSGLGFLLMLVGRFDEGLARTQEAEINIIEAIDKQDYYYNLLNRVLYSKCNQQNYEVMANAIESFALANHDKLLLSYLAFIQSYPCGSMKVDPGHPDPPNDGQPTGTGSGGGGAGGGGSRP